MLSRYATNEGYYKKNLADDCEVAGMLNKRPTQGRRPMMEPSSLDAAEGTVVWWNVFLQTAVVDSTDDRP